MKQGEDKEGMVERSDRSDNGDSELLLSRHLDVLLIIL